jgi:hypothetical protein
MSAKIIECYCGYCEVDQWCEIISIQDDMYEVECCVCHATFDVDDTEIINEKIL